MNKLLLIIPLLLILGGIALGKLVDYLSNPLTYRIQVDSPIQLSDFSGSTTVHGGDEQTYSYSVTNKANRDISGVFKFIIHEPDTPTENDADAILTIGDKTITPQKDVNETTKDLIFTSGTITLKAGDTVKAEWRITFNPRLEPGNYSFETQVVPG